MQQLWITLSLGWSCFQNPIFSPLPSAESMTFIGSCAVVCDCENRNCFECMYHPSFPTVCHSASGECWKESLLGREERMTAAALWLHYPKIWNCGLWADFTHQLPSGRNMQLLLLLLCRDSHLLLLSRGQSVVFWHTQKKRFVLMLMKNLWTYSLTYWVMCLSLKPPFNVK